MNTVLMSKYLFLLIYSLIMTCYIRYNVIANMNNSYISGCFDAAKKLAIQTNDLRLYDFCSARRTYLNEFPYK